MDGGSVYYRRQDDRWVAAIQLHHKRRTVYARTERAARRALARMQQEVARAGTLPEPGRRTVSDLLDLWQQTSAPRWKQSTAAEYSDVCDRYIRPWLGSTRLVHLSAEQIQQAYTTIRDLHGQRAVHRAHRLLSQACKFGSRLGLLGYNPCDRVVPPQYRPPRREVWTLEQLASFLTCTASHWTWPLWTVAVSTGCRPGELLALQWSDVDLHGSTVSVCRTVRRIREVWVYSAPKTAAGARVVALPPVGVSALRRQRAQQAEWRLRAGAQWPGLDLVFTSQIGLPVHSTVASHWLRDRCTAAEVPMLTFHGLRHLHASLLLAQGVAISVVSRRLGHASPGVTMSVYAHALEHEEGAVVEAIGRAMEGK